MHGLRFASIPDQAQLLAASERLMAGRTTFIVAARFTHSSRHGPGGGVGLRCVVDERPLAELSAAGGAYPRLRAFAHSSVAPGGRPGR
jgi:hypothetical protein